MAARWCQSAAIWKPVPAYYQERLGFYAVIAFAEFRLASVSDRRCMRRDTFPPSAERSGEGGAFFIPDQGLLAPCLAPEMLSDVLSGTRLD